jgi:flagellar L-ring protein precursor FlgH
MALMFASGADSLFSQQVEEEGTLIAEATARYEVGDIITVLVREEITASTSAGTNTRKESDVDSESNPNDNNFLTGDLDADGEGSRLPTSYLPNWNIEAENKHRGQGETTRSSSLVTTITCVVTGILENGNLALEGSKNVTVNREDTTMKITGMCRAEDVTPANTIASNLVYGADIQLAGKGPLWNTQRRGLVTKVLDWFSPF